MGVRKLHQYVRNRASQSTRSQKLDDYIQSLGFRDGRRSIVIDGNNLAHTIVRKTNSPGCYGGEPAMYEYILRKFVDTHLKSIHDIYFVMGNSILPGTTEWKNRREKEHHKGQTLIENVKSNKMPQSLGQYGRNGMKSYKECFSPPWIVHLIAQIAETLDIHVLQSEADKDIAIMMLARDLDCPIISADSDFLLFATQPVINVDHGLCNGQAYIYLKSWYSNVGLQVFHLPLLAVLSLNPETQLVYEDLEPFWRGLKWKGEEDDIDVVTHVAEWLKREVKHDNCCKIQCLVKAIDDIAKSGTTTLTVYFADQGRSDRLISSIKRFMIPGNGYPWQNDPDFTASNLPYKLQCGTHQLIRSNKYSPEFAKLTDETKNEVLKQRDEILSSALPIPLLTEQILHLYNTIHYRADDEEYQLPTVAELLKKYLKRELKILELDDAEYFRFKPGTKHQFMSTILEQENEFIYLSKSQVQPIYNLYAAQKEDRLRAFLACFDAEVLLYFDEKLEKKNSCMVIFLTCLRYLSKQVKLKEWEVCAFVAQFSLLDIFTQKTKHFGRLKWLTYGGDENDPVEIPVDERSLVLGNLFAAVYYATQRARVLCGQPWKDESFRPDYKNVYSGAIFQCCYRILKTNPEYVTHGSLACGQDDKRWIGMENSGKNHNEKRCYEKAAIIYDRLRKDYIISFNRFDERMKEERRKMKENEAKKTKPSRGVPKSAFDDDVVEMGRDFSELLNSPNIPGGQRKPSIDPLAPNDFIIQRVKETELNKLSSEESDGPTFSDVHEMSDEEHDMKADSFNLRSVSQIQSQIFAKSTMPEDITDFSASQYAPSQPPESPPVPVRKRAEHNRLDHKELGNVDLEDIFERIKDDEGKGLVLPADAVKPVNDKLLSEWREEPKADSGRLPARSSYRQRQDTVEDRGPTGRPSARIPYKAPETRPQNFAPTTPVSIPNSRRKNPATPNTTPASLPTRASTSARVPKSVISAGSNPDMVHDIPTKINSGRNQPTQILSKDVLKKFMKKNVTNVLASQPRRTTKNEFAN